jgi:hypothetical protein
VDADAAQAQLPQRDLEQTTHAAGHWRFAAALRYQADRPDFVLIGHIPIVILQPCKRQIPADMCILLLT